MQCELKQMAVLKTGIFLAIMYAFIMLIMMPFMLIPTLIGGRKALIAIIPMLGMLIMYPIMGFIGGVLMAALYNLIAKWVGGLQFTLESIGEATEAGPALPATVCHNCQNSIPGGLPKCPECGWSDNVE